MSNENCKEISNARMFQTTVMAMWREKSRGVPLGSPRALPVRGDLHAVLLGDVAEVEGLEAGARAQNDLPAGKIVVGAFDRWQLEFNVIKLQIL